MKICDADCSCYTCYDFNMKLRDILYKSTQQRLANCIAKLREAELELIRIYATLSNNDGDSFLIDEMLRNKLKIGACYNDLLRLKENY